MLLEGGYKKDIEKAFDAFKILRRRLINTAEMKVNTGFSYSSMHGYHRFDSLHIIIYIPRTNYIDMPYFISYHIPYHIMSDILTHVMSYQPHERVVQFILSAATLSSHGKLSVDRYISNRFPRAKKLTTTDFHKHHPRIEQDFIELRTDKDKDMAMDVDTDRDRDLEAGSVSASSTKLGNWLSPERLDLVYQALTHTLPPLEEEDEKDVDIDTNRDSTIKPATPMGLPIDTDTLIDPSILQDIPPTMIFTSTATKAGRLAKALRLVNGGLLAEAIAEFHKKVPAYEKQEALEQFRRFESTGVKVLVCTDAAAR